jgi:HAE1 family hydrophobic/amphiphilic exporter-1
MFSAFFVRRPIVAIVISIVTVIVGLVALMGLPIEQYPRLSPPMVRVTGVYPGAGAEAVEQSVATPIEQQINGVDNMIYMMSRNTSDGTASIDVTFDVGTDLNNANVLTQNRVARANSRLPQDVLQQGVIVQKINPSLLMMVSVASPGGTYDAEFLNNYAMINVRDQLLRVPGVSQVELLGGSEYAMRIWIKPDRLAALGLTSTDVWAAVRDQNVQAPAGKIGAAPSAPGQENTYTVSAPGRLTTPEEFGDIIIKETADGRIVRVRDVARVELGSENYKSFGRLNGKPSAMLAIYLLPGANQLESSKGIYAMLESMKTIFPKDVIAEVGYDTTPAVEASIEEIVQTLFEAVLLVIIVVFIFLQNGRATLIPLLTVPVSLIGTFAIFPLVGFTINTVSLFGLVLAIGIVVDDAIVVVEAVMHHIEHGMSPREATLKAMSEVSGPVIAIALILAAVFVPVAFLGGITGMIYQQFAMTIAFSVVLSAFNALTLSPALAAMLLKPTSIEGKGPLKAFYRWFNRVFGRATTGYVGIARSFVRKSVLSVVGVGAFAVLSLITVGQIPSGFVPNEDQGIFLVNVMLPNAASLERTDAVCGKIEKILAQNPAIESYNTVGGLSFLTNAYTSNVASFLIRLKPWEERTAKEEHAKAIMATLNRQFMAIPEAISFCFAPPTIPGFGAAGGFSAYLQDRSGAMSVGDLQEQTARFMAAASQRPELTSLFTQFDAGVPQIGVQLDREKARKLGVTIQDVFTTMQAALGGAYVNDFNRFGLLYRVYMQSEPEYRQSPSDIGAFYVRSATTGEMIPLSTIVTSNDTSGAEVTYRFNLLRSVAISGNAASGFSSGQALTALEDVAKEVLPQTMSLAFSGLSYEEKRAPSPIPTFVLAIVLVFLLLASQYDSWRLPWSVLLGTPIAAFGAFFGVWMMGIDNNVYTQIGLILLIGLAAKNSILIVEFAKEKQDREGLSPQDAALESARLRFRPILMTAFAFILGVVPLMTASGSGAGSRVAMGTTVFYGMLVATAFGVIIVPGLFAFIEGFAYRKRMRQGAMILLIIGVGAGLQSCKVGPDYVRPSLPISDTWRERARTDSSFAIEPHWRVYEDQVLTTYISTALDSNYDVQATLARIEAARANVTIANSELFPQLGLGGSATGIRNSANRVAVLNPGAALGPTGIFGIMGTLSWELDIFGRIRRGAEAQTAQLRASEASYRASRLIISAAVAEAYITLRKFDALRQIIDSNLASRREYERLARTLFEGGKTSELDWRQAEGELRRVEAEVPVINTAIAQTENALNVLLARPIGTDVQRGTTLTQQRVPADVAVGQPSELLQRRPDVIIAEQRVIAANALIGRAIAEQYPRLSLSVGGGVEALSGQPLIDANSLMWNAVGNLVQPIFQGGRLAAQVDAADASTRAAVAEYQRTVVVAFREVNDAMVDLRNRRIEVTSASGVVTSNREVLRLSELRYRYGATPYLQVLDAQRSLLDAQRRELDAKTSLYLAYVALYRALGGGWR